MNANGKSDVLKFMFGPSLSTTFDRSLGQSDSAKVVGQALYCVASIVCERNSQTVHEDQPLGLRILPHRLTWTRRVPRVHHIDLGSRTLLYPSEELSHEKRAIWVGHFFSAAVQFVKTAIGFVRLRGALY
jgi:hypothetical protein